MLRLILRILALLFVDAGYRRSKKSDRSKVRAPVHGDQGFRLEVQRAHTDLIPPYCPSKAPQYGLRTVVRSYPPERGIKAAMQEYIMSTKWTRTASFRFYNAEPRNPNWSWSAVSADGQTVVVTLWQHEFAGLAGEMTYTRSALGDWHKGNGSRLFFEDLLWALAYCGGIVRVIVAVRDWSASPRVRMAECYPQKNLYMRVTHVNLETGAFRLEQVAPANGATSVRKIVVDAPSVAVQG
jgi:hypothetical protein